MVCSETGLIHIGPPDFNIAENQEGPVFQLDT